MGTQQLSAHAMSTSNFLATVAHLEDTALAKNAPEKQQPNSACSIQSPYSGAEKETRTVEVSVTEQEEEDVEFVSHKKSDDKDDQQVLSDFFAASTPYLFLHFRNRFFLTKSLNQLFFSRSLYLLFEVFRL